MIEAAMIDSREPVWIQKLTFGGVPTSVIELASGDVQAVTSDGHVLCIERKTPDDLLNTLREERLFPQAAKLAEPRLDQLLGNQPTTYWPYLIVTGPLHADANGRVHTERGETGWSLASVWGALLNVQEMGVFVTLCNGDADFERCVLALGKRERGPIQQVLPPRPAALLGPGHAMLTALPGIGVETASKLLTWAGGVPAHVLAGLVDLDIQAPVGETLRRRVRQVLGLRDREIFDLWTNPRGDEVLKVLEKEN